MIRLTNRFQQKDKVLRWAPHKTNWPVNFVQKTGENLNSNLNLRLKIQVVTDELKEAIEREMHFFWKENHFAFVVDDKKRKSLGWW